MKLELARKHCKSILDESVTHGIGKLLAGSLLLVIEYLVERDKDENATPSDTLTVMPPPPRRE
jgi:hypothetical protein